MKLKQLAVLALSGAMTLSLVVPVMGVGTTITGSYQEITIDVTLTDASKAAINPYKMAVKPTADDGTTVLKEMTQVGRIATLPLVMYNGSEFDLNVSAAVTTRMGKKTNMRLIDTTPDENSTEKEALVFLEFMNNSMLPKPERMLAGDALVKNKPAETINGVDGTKLIDAFNSWVASPSYDEDDANQILLSQNATSEKENVAFMYAGKKTGDTVTPEKGSFVLYRLGGDAVPKPEEGWTLNDAFDIDIAFSFTPLDVEDGKPINYYDGKNTTADAQVTVGLPTGVKLADAMFAWEIVDSDLAGGGNASFASGQYEQIAKLNLPGAGKVDLKCTVRGKDGNVFISTKQLSFT